MRPIGLDSSFAWLRAGVILAVLASGCSHPGHATYDAGVDVPASCTERASAWCAALETCGGGFPLRERFASRVECEERVAIDCALVRVAPGSGASDAVDLACAAALRATSCPDVVREDAVIACRTPAGAGTEGSACAHDAQCASATCVVATGARCGTCGAAPTNGSVCLVSACGPTLACNGHLVCVEPATEGAICSRAVPCAPGLSCVGADHVTMGTCVAEGTTVGTTCDPALVTAAACDATIGLACDPVASTCVAVRETDPGASCDSVATDETCVSGAFCALTTTGTRCVAPAREGLACDRYAGPPCAFPAVCVTAGGATSGTCALPDGRACR